MTTKNMITIVDRHQISVSGTTKVVAVAPVQAIIETGDDRLLILGKDFEVNKLDVENGNFELTGKFDSIKFIPKKESTNLFKRIFK